MVRQDLHAPDPSKRKVVPCFQMVVTGSRLLICRSRPLCFFAGMAAPLACRQGRARSVSVKTKSPDGRAFRAAAPMIRPIKPDRMTRNLISCGPFTNCTAAALRDTLLGLGLAVTDDGSPPEILRDTGGGWRIEARGPAVRGYFLADDGEEAEVQDIKRLIRACCLPNREVSFSGSAEIASGTLLVISARAHHDGRIVTWTGTRTVLGPAGKVSTFRDPVM